MSKCIFIGDLKIGTGFLFTGIDAVVAESAEDAEKKCTELLLSEEINQEYALVMVQKKFFSGFSKALVNRIRKISLPLIYPVEVELEEK